MTARNDNYNRRWAVPLIAFVAGLLIGLIVLGWWLWPVQWTHALPQDLRASERDAYLVMVAESYATTGDSQTAKARLETWPSAQLKDDLSRLKARLTTENAKQAGQVQQLEGLIGVQSVPALLATPLPATAATPKPSVPAVSGALAQLRRLCTAGLWVLLILLGVAAVVWLWRRWRSSQAPTFGPAIDTTGLGPEITGGLARERTPADIATEAKSRWPAGGQTEAEEGESFLSGRDEELPSEASPLVTTLPRQAPPVPPVRPVTARVPAAAGAVLAKVGEYRAVYQMGEPDYDEAFDISDSSGAYVGQCGLELNDPIGRGHDQAAALQVWLWDTNDPDTKVKVLMSEGAYRDTGLRDQLKGEHEAIQVRPGTEFELESYNLVLRGAVERLEYAEQEPLYGIFAELAVRMQVFRKG